MMNKFNSAFVVVLALLVASCQLPFAGTGSIKVQIPAGNAGRVAADGHGATARLQLVRNNAVVPLAGKQFVEASRSGGTITIDGIPAGSGYVLYFAAGDQTDNFFVVSDFGASGAFEVSAGTDTAVSVTAKPSPLALLASGAGPHKSAVVGDQSTLYFTKANGFYSATTQAGALSPGSGTSLSGTEWGARTLNSLGITTNAAGALTLSFNTNEGVGYHGGAAFSFSMLDKDGVEMVSKPNVTRSGAFTYGAKTLHLYSGKGLTAGMAVTDSGEEDQNPWWFDIESLLELGDLSESLKDQDGLILDFATTDEFAYVSTVLGVFRIDTDVLNTDEGDTDALADQFINPTDAIKVGVKLGDRALAIGPVGAFGTGTGGLVFAGTKKGLFSAATNIDGQPQPNFDSLALVDGTFGLNIGAVSTTNFFGTAYTAAWAKNSGDVVVVKGQNQLVVTLPGLSGLPTGPLTLTWWNADDGEGHYDLKLVISGDNGTVEYSVPDATAEIGV